MEEIKKINENEVKVDGVIYRKQEEPKPGFRVGEWVKTVSGKTYRIEAWDEDNWIKSYDKNGDRTLINPIGVNFATEGEIESHLKKICDEKYPRGTKFRSLSCGGIGTIKDVFSYYIENDQLTNGDTIYAKGKWAEIIPDKKKLPKTKEEFSVFLNKFNGYTDLPFPPEVHSFLEDYE